MRESHGSVDLRGLPCPVPYSQLFFIIVFLIQRDTTPATRGWLSFFHGHTHAEWPCELLHFLVEHRHFARKTNNNFVPGFPYVLASPMRGVHFPCRPIMPGKQSRHAVTGRESVRRLTRVSGTRSRNPALLHDESPDLPRFILGGSSRPAR